MGKGLLLQSHVGMQIDLGCLSRFMAEPEGYHAQIHTPPEQIHGYRVPHMGSSP